MLKLTKLGANSYMWAEDGIPPPEKKSPVVRMATERELVREWNEVAKYCPEHMSIIKELDDLLPHQRKEHLNNVKVVG